MKVRRIDQPKGVWPEPDGFKKVQKRPKKTFCVQLGEEDPVGEDTLSNWPFWRTIGTTLTVGEDTLSNWPFWRTIGTT
ncbi:MAG: hypothetical protein WCK05_05990, partial [Planctomycetota bacterium]